MSAPLQFRWDGESLIPLRPRQADRAYTVGQVYTLEEIKPRSLVTHRHYFATLHELWQNLPEEQADRFPSEEHFRKHCLIMTGYRDERSLVASSKAEAQRIAAFIKPADDTSIVTIRDAVVRVWTAKSQSVKAMGAKEFQQSKQDVLDYAATLVGVSVPEAEKNALEAA